MGTRRRHHRSTRRRGLAIIVVIVLLVTVNLVVLGLVLGGARDQTIAIRRLETLRAFYAAEGVMNMAIREMAVNVDEDGDGGIGSISDDADAGTDPIIGDGAGFVTVSSGGGQFTLSAEGRSGDATRTLESILE